MNRVVEVGAVALQGIDGSRVSVEAGMSRQLPGIAIVGLPDAALGEAKQRVRQAAAATGLRLTDRFVLVNLRPADLPKHGSGFDLAIALAVLAVSDLLPRVEMHDIAHIGELGLDGTVRRPRGLLSSVIAAKEEGYERVMVPFEGLSEASLVSGVEIVGVRNLQGAVNWYRGEASGWSTTPSEEGLEAGVTPRSGSGAQSLPDVSEIVGQPFALDALTIAAVGRHHFHMVSPPGAGKTMLASRLPSILPPLDDDEALTVSSMRSLMSQQPLTGLERQPPFEQPHHTASSASVIGSGRGGLVIPGTLSLATHGVVFLDEAPEFPRTVLDALRQPLERGEVDIHRAGLRTTLPAKVQLILAQNPCPCGKAGLTVDDATCVCTPMQRRRYAGKISGPLRDRLDIRITLRRVSTVAVTAACDTVVTSASVRKRVIEARNASKERLRGTPWSVNADVPGSRLRSGHMRLPKTSTEILDRALALGTITLRGYDRTLRVAWSIADLEGASSPGRDEVARALMFREEI